MRKWLIVAVAVTGTLAPAWAKEVVKRSKSGSSYLALDSLDLSSPDSMTDIGKKMGARPFAMRFKRGTPLPKRVAVVGFEVTYMKVSDSSQVGNMLIWDRFKLDDAGYQELTDGLYGVLEQRLRTAGFDVVPRDELFATAGYAALPEVDAKDNARVGVRTATGMSFLTHGGVSPGAIKDVNQSAKAVTDLAGQLSVDAVLKVNAVFEPCNIAGNVQKGGGLKICGGLTAVGMDLYTEKDDGSRGYTAVLSYPYYKAPAKFDGFVYEETIAPVVSAGFFATRERTADATAFADGITSIFATGLDISLAALRDYGGG